jgi:hypothetical protein
VYVYPPVVARQRLGKHVSLEKKNYLRSSKRLVIPWTSCLILSSHECLGLPSGIFPSGFSTNTKYRLRGEIRSSVVGDIRNIAWFLRGGSLK